MTDTKTYLTRMVVFLVVVSVGMAFVAQTLATIFIVNPLLNGFIFAIIIGGIAFNFRQVVVLAPEAAWLESFHQAGKQGTDPTTSFADTPIISSANELRLLSPMARMLEDKRSRGSSARITLTAPVMRTLLDGIGARLEESRDLARYLTGLCIFLGLLGTFWGLLGTVSSIANVIQSLTVSGDDLAVMFTALKQGLQAPLGSMSTAFASSLFGLGGSLVLGFFDLQAGQAQNAFYNELEEWLSGLTRLSSGTGPGDGEHGVSAYTEALLEQTAESLQELQNIMARGEQTRSSGNDQLAELNSKLSLFADQMKTQQHVLLRVAETQRDLGPLLRSMSDVAISLSAPASGGSMDESTRMHIRNIDTGLTHLTSALESGRSESVRELRNEIKLLAKTVAATRDGAPVNKE
jgi:biopolymer transport protein ExbB/TolQ